MRKNDKFVFATRKFDYDCIKSIIKVFFSEYLILYLFASTSVFLVDMRVTAYFVTQPL